MQYFALFMQYCKFLYTLYDKYTYFIDLSHAQAHLHARAKSFLFFLTTNLRFVVKSIINTL